MLQINALQEFTEGTSLLRDIANTSDCDFDRLKRYITEGWPRHVPSQMLPYSKFSHELTIQDGIIYRESRIIPLRSFRQRILHILHQNHPGIVRMIRLARQYFWWPGIDASINAFVQRCSVCHVNARKRTSAHLRSWADTPASWSACTLTPRSILLDLRRFIFQVGRRATAMFHPRRPYRHFQICRFAAHYCYR